MVCGRLGSVCSNGSIGSTVNGIKGGMLVDCKSETIIEVLVGRLKMIPSDTPTAIPTNVRTVHITPSATVTKIAIISGFGDIFLCILLYCHRV